jgi:hypothetical protein
MRPEIPESDGGSPAGWQEPAWEEPGGPMPAPPAGTPGQAAQPGWSRGSRPKTGRVRRALLLTGIVLGLAGLAASVLGLAGTLMPRTFTAAQRAQIIAWQMGKRWRTWPAGQIFPQTIGYALPPNALGGETGLSLTAHRVGIAPQARCGKALGRGAAALLTRHGCLAVLRATYDDPTSTLAVTVAVAVLPGPAAASAAARLLPGLNGAGPHGGGVRAVPFRRTPVALFRGSQGQVSWQLAAGPYLVLATVGYADGRPWLASINDSYTRAEMLSLAAGVGKWVASHLGAPPRPPHCPGSPAC